jgi:hypothetical protein
LETGERAVKCLFEICGHGLPVGSTFRGKHRGVGM